MPELAIVCDDLSSATDCGVQVARWGMRVTVPLEPPEAWEGLPATEVMSVTTESRPATAEAAYLGTERAGWQLQALGYRHFFKSMDSTLRGNVAAEVRALAAVAQPDLVIAAPAFPTYGRTTQDGIHKLHGAPIHETEFGSDPLTPVRDSDLRRLFAPLRLNLKPLSLSDMRVPKAELARELTELASNGQRVLVCDVEEEDDLARIVQAVAATHLRPLWVGSTGLAGHVAGYFRPAPVAAAADLPAGLGKGAILAGTASEHTRRQFAVLAQREDAAVIKVNPHALVVNLAAAEAERDRCVQLARQALGQGRAAALGVLSSRDEVAEVTQLGAQAGLTASETSARITLALAQAAHALIETVPDLTGLVLTGGDTASAVCARLGARAIEILREVEPGIPLTRLVGPHAVPVIVKAGAFGSPEVLISALQHLTVANS
jgi:uncharacterized protein YgbK (DUF1537 family)